MGEIKGTRYIYFIGWFLPMRGMKEELAWARPMKCPDEIGVMGKCSS